MRMAATLLGGIVALNSATLACAGIVATEPGPAADALIGIWGGQRLRLVLDGSGGRLEADCASGTISGPVRPGADGRFVARGRFENHAAGPQAGDVVTAVSTADSTRFSGGVEGERMWLEILPDGAGTPQRFELRRGVQVKRVRCL